jgi:single-strand DNA-binding protein
MNKVVLLGRMIKDVDLRFVGGTGTAVAQFTLACDKRLSRDKKAEFEEKGKQTADFIRCKSFGKTAETISQYFGKGSKILLEGSIDTGSYKKDDGTTVYTTDVLVNNFEFVESAKKKDKEDFSFGSEFEQIEDDDSDSIPF